MEHHLGPGSSGRRWRQELVYRTEIPLAASGSSAAQLAMGAEDEAVKRKVVSVFLRPDQPAAVVPATYTGSAISPTGRFLNHERSFAKTMRYRFSCCWDLPRAIMIHAKAGPTLSNNHRPYPLQEDTLGLARLRQKIHPVDDRLRFLAPVDPVVWDRRRFQLFCGSEYKWRPMCRPTSAAWAITRCPCYGGEQILGWANLKVVDGRLQHELGFAGPRPRGSTFQLAVDEALQRMQEFLEI